MNLLILGPSARRLVNEDLATGSVAHWPESEWRPLVSETDRLVSLDQFEAVADELVNRFERFDAQIDAWLAPRLHQTLGLTRREAAEPGVWRFLAIIHRPEIIRHRWEGLSGDLLVPRFWSIGTRHTSNLFARLWWIAELTRAGKDYGLTEQVLARQSLAIQLFVRSWSEHRPALEACASVLADASSETIERATRELSRHLSTVPLEGLTAADLRRLINTFAG